MATRAFLWLHLVRDKFRQPPDYVSCKSAYGHLIDLNGCYELGRDAPRHRISYLCHLLQYTEVANFGLDELRLPYTYGRVSITFHRSFQPSKYKNKLSGSWCCIQNRSYGSEL